MLAKRRLGFRKCSQLLFVVGKKAHSTVAATNPPYTQMHSRLSVYLILFVMLQAQPYNKAQATQSDLALVLPCEKFVEHVPRAVRRPPCNIVRLATAGISICLILQYACCVPPPHVVCQTVKFSECNPRELCMVNSMKSTRRWPLPLHLPFSQRTRSPPSADGLAP